MSFFKIDVDGYEAKLLKGAAETLKRFRPTMILEVCDYTLRTAAKLPAVTKDHPEYGKLTLEMLSGLQEIGYRFLWEEDLSSVSDILETVTRFDLSGRSINLLVVPV